MVNVVHLITDPVRARYFSSACQSEKSILYGKISIVVALVLVAGAVALFILTSANVVPQPFIHTAKIVSGSVIASATLLFFNGIRKQLPPPRYYNSANGSIKVSSEDLKKNPEIHLGLLAKYLSRQNNLSVRFFGQEGIGVGVSREYISILFTHLITQNEIYFAKRNDGFYDPKLPRDCVDEKTLSLHRDMGRIMGWCSKTDFLIGSHFDLSVFRIILTFLDNRLQFLGDEIDTLCLPNEEILLKMAPFINPTLGFLSKAEWNAEDIEKAKDYAVVMELVEEEDLRGKSDSDLIAFLRKALCMDYLDSLSKSSAIETIRACYPIAQGIYQVNSPSEPELSYNFRYHADGHYIDAQKLHNKVQGSLNRQVIVDNISISGRSDEQLNQQVAWLKEWILDTTTTKENLENFLMYATGLRAMPANGSGISIGAGTERGSIRAAACSRELYIPFTSNDMHTKAFFIACLISVISGTGFNRA